MEKEYSQKIADAIKEALEDDDFKFAFYDDVGVFKFSVTSKSKIKHLEFLIMVHNSDYTVYVSSAIGADIDDSDMMKEMAEFVCRANFGLRNGNFEMDFRDGEIRYKVYVDCEEMISENAVLHSILLGSAMYERYSTGIMDIVFNDGNAEDAIAKCEH